MRRLSRRSPAKTGGRTGKIGHPGGERRTGAPPAIRPWQMGNSPVREGVGMDVTAGLERYLRHHRAEGSTAKTQENHTISIGQFAAWLAREGRSGDLADLDADALRVYIEHLRARGLAQASVATKVRSLKAFGKWLVREEYVGKDPFGRVGQTKVDDTAKATLTPAEVDRLLATCDRRRVVGARDFALILLLFSTGLRAGEAVALRRDDLDGDKGLITVRRGKGGKFRVVPLGRTVERAIDKYLDHPRRRQYGRSPLLFLTDDGNPLDPNHLWHLLERRGKRAGVHAHPHKFRHSAAIQYLRSGGRVEVLRSMLGHTTLDMTLHYARIVGLDLAEAHATADPARSLKTRV